MADVMSLRRRQTMLGQTKKLLDEGCSVTEIREKLKLSESTVRSLVATIATVETMKRKVAAENIE